MNFEGYDVVVVGSGLGGATTALKLCESGLRVLVLERGIWPKRDADDWNPKEILLKSRYRGPDLLKVRQYGAKKFSVLPNNEVVGGMSVFYGGAAFRLRERDFERWPVSYREWEPWYSKAEALLQVHGDAALDPCAPARSAAYPFAPEAPTAPAKRIQKAARDLGLSPFPIPLALNRKNSQRPLCLMCHTCDGYPCKVEAKTDATTLLAMAPKSHLTVVTGIEALKIVQKGSTILSLLALDRVANKQISIPVNRLALAAGALNSPALLLNSQLYFESEGALLIGKNLMRHCNAVVSGVFTFKTNPESIFHKQTALMDFYEDRREKMGTATGVIQDIYTPTPDVVKHFAPTGFKYLAARFSAHIQSLLCVAEDEAQLTNSVILDHEANLSRGLAVRVNSQYTSHDFERRNFLISKAKAILRKAGAKFFKLMEINSFSHAVGTLRMGLDPSSSVVNEHGKVHGLSNVWVSDGSFMPSSGGVNPSLTIVAHALRVADKMVKS